jgi:hypothetical protein
MRLSEVDGEDDTQDSASKNVTRNTLCILNDTNQFKFGPGTASWYNIKETSFNFPGGVLRSVAGCLSQTVAGKSVKPQNTWAISKLSLIG